MKLQKNIILPLLLVALVSCGSGNNNSQKGSSQSVPVARELANVSVANAIKKTSEETITSIDLAASVEGVVTHQVVQSDGVVLENDRIEAKSSAAIQANDLDKENAQFAVDASVNSALFANDIKLMGISGEVGTYYADEFAYLNLGLSNFNGQTGQTTSLSQKQKMVAGPFPGLPTFEELDLELPDTLPIDFVDVLSDSEILGAIGAITASEKDGILTVKYEVKQADLTQVLLKVALSVLKDDQSSLDYEEIAESIQELEDMLYEKVLIRKAIITIVVGETGYLNGLNIDLDIDVLANDDYWAEEDETTPVVNQTTTFKGNVDLSLIINEPVTIAFPSFEDYALVDQIDLSQLFNSAF